MMDVPPPPRDSSLRNIIDKLAEFVARNGPEFEMITKQKQHGNPKFDFLYGGEYAGYYQYRVVAEQAFLKQQSGLPQSSQHTSVHHMPHNQNQQTLSPALPHHFTQGPPNQMHMAQTSGLTQNSHEGNNFSMNLQQPPPTSANSASIALNITGQIEAINMQQNTLREQIHQSESNLSAQHSAMMAQQSKQVDEAIETAQNTHLEKQAEENSIALREFDGILQPIIESCTKDSISAGLWSMVQRFNKNCILYI
uniref:Calcium homeostasis endoplasmic reticulum protein n=1 Tax=Bactrocera latifrons TaxID=174628 RepID=A0A0K8URH6_BACLA